MDTIKIDFAACQKLIGRVSESNLSHDDQFIIKRIIAAYLALTDELKQKKASIARLKEVAFGTKRRKSHGMKLNLDAPRQPGSSTPPNNRGRNSAADYTGATRQVVKHESLQAGDDCPLLCGGKLYRFKPREEIKISGGAIANAILLELERLRCNTCGELFTAKLPEGVSTAKYDASFTAGLAVQRYLLGTPLHRIEQMQKYLGVPLLDSTQYDILANLAEDILPVYNVLLLLAANSQKLSVDDTRVRILSVMAENKDKPNNQRRGTHTNGLIADYYGRTIVLYQAGTKSSGRRLSELLSKRIDEAKFVLMSDAASSNRVKGYDNIIEANCLAHGRRRFSEIEEDYPEECQIVIEAIAQVYRHESYCKQYELDDHARLQYHRENSLPIMGLLHQYLSFLLEHDLIAHNSAIGDSAWYMLNHWDKLTCFLEVPGCLLDNNTMERMLKIPIRQRKNSLFFKTERGAEVGSMTTSLLTTAIANDINPLAYLQALIENKEQVVKEPEAYLPWNWQAAVLEMQVAA